MSIRPTNVNVTATTIPTSGAYVASYDTGDKGMVTRPVVAIGVNNAAGVALVLNLEGNLVRVDDETLPGDFLGVTPADWTE